MQGIWCFFYICIIFVLGYCAVSIICGRSERSVPEILGLSFTAGSGCMGILLFWISLAGFRPTRGVIFSIAVAVSTLFLLLWKRKRLPRPVISFPDRLNDLWLIIPAMITGSAMFAVCVHALAFPLYEWDAFAIWGMKAKVLAMESLRSGPIYFQDLSFSYSHLDYPLLLPFLLAGVYGITGCIDDQAAKIMFPLLYMSLGLVVYCGLRWKISRIQSAFLTGILMGTPVLVRWAGSGSADSVLTLFLAASACSTLKWLEEEKMSDLLLSVLFVTFCAHTKNEGMAIVLITFALLFIFAAGRFKGHRFFGLLIFVLSVSALLLPLLWWAKDIPRTHENYLSKISLQIIMENTLRAGVIIRAFLKEAVALSRWGGLWLLVAAMTVLGKKAFKRQYVVVIWLLLLMQIGIYQFIYLITPWNVTKLIGFSLQRLLLHITPFAIFIIGYHWSEISPDRPGTALNVEEPEPRMTAKSALSMMRRKSSRIR